MLSTDKAFIGGHNEIKKLDIILNDLQQITINYQQIVHRRNIQRHFIPTTAPNFGVLSKTVTKILKHHWHRTISNA